MFENSEKLLIFAPVTVTFKIVILFFNDYKDRNFLLGNCYFCSIYLGWKILVK